MTSTGRSMTSKRKPAGLYKGRKMSRKPRDELESRDKTYARHLDEAGSIATSLVRARAGVAVTAAVVSGAALSLTALRISSIRAHNQRSDTGERARRMENSLERRSSLG
jgi:hypothetical protein